MTDSLHAILGRIPSGIYILTTGNGDHTTGMLASWVMQAGFDPPMVTVAVKQGRYVADWLAAGRPFVLNVVGEGQTHLLKHFGKGFELGEPAFTDLVVQPNDHGIPILADAIGHLDCTPKAQVDSGDHHIILAQISDGAHAKDNPPMVHIRKSGAHY